MAEKERVHTVMQTDFLRLDPATPMREAVAALVEGGHAAAPVVDDTGTLVGIVTQKDCFRAALNASYYQQWKGTVAEAMTPDVAVLEAETDYVTAAEAFLDSPFRVFPVVQAGRLVGMLRRSDLLKVFLKYG